MSYYCRVFENEPDHKDEIMIEWIHPSGKWRFSIWIDIDEAGWTFVSKKHEVDEDSFGSLDRETLEKLYKFLGTYYHGRESENE